MLASSQSHRARLRRLSHTLGVALVALALGCPGERADESDDRTEGEASTNVDTTGSGTESTESAEQDEAGTKPTPRSNSPISSCTASTWTHPSEPKREARCVQHWDETGLEPILRYVCSCDVNACPIDQEPNGNPSVQLEDCVIDGVAPGCEDSLRAACGSPAGQHGYCESPYYGLTPTRPEQNPPASATVVCFEQSDGTHACQCPSASELVPTNETDCNRALLTACQTSCDSAAGQCAPTEGGYHCACTAGFDRMVDGGLCDYVLFHACEPQCSNEMGACYWDPSGGPDIICRCNDDVEPRTLKRDPNVMGDECRTPLVDTCGGSTEGPNAWPQ
jgi:hypothetical protein